MSKSEPTFTVTITDPQRRAEWIDILGTDTVPVVSPIPHRASAPGRPDSLFYRLDLTRVTPDQRARLVKHLAAKFGLLESAVERDMGDYQVPILADHTVLTGTSAGLAAFL